MIVGDFGYGYKYKNTIWAQIGLDDVPGVVGMLTVLGIGLSVAALVLNMVMEGPGVGVMSNVSSSGIEGVASFASFGTILAIVMAVAVIIGLVGLMGRMGSSYVGSDDSDDDELDSEIIGTKSVVKESVPLGLRLKWMLGSHNTDDKKNNIGGKNK